MYLLLNSLDHRLYPSLTDWLKFPLSKDCGVYFCLVRSYKWRPLPNVHFKCPKTLFGIHPMCEFVDPALCASKFSPQTISKLMFQICSLESIQFILQNHFKKWFLVLILHSVFMHSLNFKFKKNCSCDWQNIGSSNILYFTDLT